MCEIIATSASDAYSANNLPNLPYYCIIAICQSAENILCSEIILALSQQILLPKCLSSSAVYSHCSVAICAPQNNFNPANFFFEVQKSFLIQGKEKKIV